MRAEGDGGGAGNASEYSHYDEICILVSYFYSYSVFLPSYQLLFLVRRQISKKITIFSNLLFPTGHGLDCHILKFIRK